MSILNLGLQAVALAKEKMPEDKEAEAATYRYHSLKTPCALVERTGEFRVASMDSIAPSEVTTDRYCTETGAEGKKFIVFIAAPQYTSLMHCRH